MANAIYKAYKHLHETNFMGFADKLKERKKPFVPRHKRKKTETASS